MSRHHDRGQPIAPGAGDFYTIPVIAIGAFAIVGIVVDSGDPMVPPPNITTPTGATTIYDAVPADAPNLRLHFDWLYAATPSLAWGIDAAASAISYISWWHNNTLAVEYGPGEFLAGPILTTGNDDSPTSAPMDTGAPVSLVFPMWATATGANFSGAGGAPEGPRDSWSFGDPVRYPVMSAVYVDEGPGTYGPVVVHNRGVSGTWAAVMFGFLAPPPCECPPFEYPYRWPQFYVDLLSNDALRDQATVLLEERDRALEDHLRAICCNGTPVCTFDYPYRWSQIVPDLFSGDKELVGRAVAFCEENDIALETNLANRPCYGSNPLVGITCQFDYPSRWPAIYEALLSGDDRQVRAAVALLEERDRALEDHLRLRVCHGGS